MPPAPTLPKAQLLLGPAKSGKTRLVLEIFLKAPQETLLIMPTREHVRRAARRLADAGGAAFVEGLVTFRDLSKKILHSCKRFHPVLNDAQRLWILRRLLREMESQNKLVFLKGAAQSPGYLETLADFVKELKHAEIFSGKLREALRKKGPEPKDQEVLEMYSRYQGVLDRREAFDQEGLLWQAKQLLDRGAAVFSASAPAQTLLVDGFDSFTPTQLLFLQRLAGGMRRTVLSLPMEKDSARPHVFAHAQKTRESLTALFAVEEQWCGNSGDTSLIPNYPNPQLQACIDMAAEARLCAAQIKRLLAYRAVDPRPSIAVYARHAKPYRELLEHEFRRHGLPQAQAKGPGLQQSPCWIFVRNFLRAHASRDISGMLAVLSSPFAAGANRDMPDAELSRRLFLEGGISEFSGDWKTRLRHAAKSRFPEMAETLPQRWEACLEAFGGWPKNLSASGHLAELGKRMAAWFRAPDKGDTHQEEWAALRETAQAFASFRDAWASQEPMTLEEFCEELELFVREKTLSPFGKQSPVYLCEGDSLQGASFDAVFVLGLNENVFPSNRRQRSLYGQAERIKMIEAGLDLQQDTDKDAQESLLFYQVLSSAKHRLFVSCHQRNAQEKECMPSAFFRDLQKAASGKRVHGDTPRSGQTDSEQWACPDDAFASLAMRPQARDLRMAWLKQDASRLRRWLRAAALERAREYRRGFSAHDGQLQAPGLRADLRKQYGMDAVTSASKLNEYAKCPFRFFGRHVLGLDMPEQPFGELDRRTRGTLMHDILWKLFHEHFQVQTHASGAEALAAAQMDLPAVAANHFEDFQKNRGVLRPGLWAWEKNLMLSQLKAFLDFEENFLRKNPQRRPAYFELAFGMDKNREGTDPASRKEPLTLRQGHASLAIRGKIDRIDIEENNYWVLDYKSGSAKVGAMDIRKGRDVQLPVYVFAAGQLFESMGIAAAPGGAALINTSPPKHPQGLKKDKKWEEILDAAREKIFEYAEGISRGRFTPTPGENKCVPSCEYRGICRFEERRIARKLATGQEDND